MNLQDDFIERVTGDRPRYFRAPKGHCYEECQANLDQWGYKLIQWDVDTKDWDLEGSGSEQKRIEDSINILKEKFSKEKESYLILMHDTENYTVSDIAPWIIEKSGMKEKGYRFVTVAECLGDKHGMYISGKIYDNTKNEDLKNKDNESERNIKENDNKEFTTPISHNDTFVSPPLTNNNTIPFKNGNGNSNPTKITKGNNTNIIDKNYNNQNLNSGASTVKTISLLLYFFIFLMFVFIF